MLACLALEFKAYRQHAQVIGNFNKDFVHSGDFPKEISRKISRVQEVRHASDYDDFYIVSVDDAKEQVETAKEVVEMVDKYLQKKLLVTPKQRLIQNHRSIHRSIRPYECPGIHVIPGFFVC